MTDESTAPTLHEVLRRALEGRLAELHTAMPGRVEAFDPELQRCDVQPLLQRVVTLPDGTTEVTSRPLIQGVPVVYPRGGGWRITWPLARGDLVLLVFAERALDAWLAGDGGAPVQPGASRKHDLTDAIAIPAIAPAENVIPQIGTTDLVIGREDESVEIRLTPTGVVIEGASVSLGAGATQAAIGAAFADLFAAHVHQSAAPGSPTGPPALGAVPITPEQIDATKSGKVKIG
jgi:hypothetical protein